MKLTTASIQDFAFNFGAGLKQAYSVCDVIHTAYAKTDAVSQTAMKAQWMLGYVMGRTGLDTVKAARILASKRVERSAENERIVNAAGKDFSYNIKRDGSKAKGKARNDKQNIVVPADIQTLATRLVAACQEYEGAASLIAAAIAHAKAA